MDKFCFSFQLIFRKVLLIFIATILNYLVFVVRKLLIIKVGGLQPFLRNRPFLESLGPKCPHKALMSFTSAELLFFPVK